MKKKLGGFI